MKPLHFIYTRRWLVILGLFVVFASLGVLYWMLSLNDKDATATENHDGENHQEHMVEDTPVPSAALVNDATTWNPGAASNDYEEGTEEATVMGVVNQIGIALQDKNGEALHALLSSEIKDVFTVESVEAAMGEAVGLNLEPTGGVTIEGDFAEQEVTGTDENGQVEKFKMVLRKEDGQWKLYGTTKLE